MTITRTTGKPTPPRTEPQTTLGPQSTLQPIAQSELREFADLAAVVRRKKEMREDFIRRVEAGVPVEPGTMCLELDYIESRVLTRAKVLAILGPERTEKLVAAVALTMSRRLKVREVEASDSQSTTDARVQRQQDKGRQKRS